MNTEKSTTAIINLWDIRHSNPHGRDIPAIFNARFQAQDMSISKRCIRGCPPSSGRSKDRRFGSVRGPIIRIPPPNGSALTKTRVPDWLKYDMLIRGSRGCSPSTSPTSELQTLANILDGSPPPEHTPSSPLLSEFTPRDGEHGNFDSKDRVSDPVQRKQLR